MPGDANAYLGKLADLDDQDIDLAKAALALGTVHQSVASLERYENHLKKLVRGAGERHAELLKAGAQDDAGTRLAALKYTLSEKHEYLGDLEHYDHLDNCNLLRVIDRGRGIPITLGLLYIYAGRAQGWAIDGLDVPGHFLCRIEKDGVRLIFDPFDHCKIMEAPDLRELIKKTLGPEAELQAGFFEPATNREILIRLQNNIKFRQIETEDYTAALKTVEAMRMIDPQEYRLLLDAGVLYARTDQPRAAIDVLEEYIKKAPQDRDRHDAALLLQQLKEDLG